MITKCENLKEVWKLCDYEIKRLVKEVKSEDEVDNWTAGAINAFRKIQFSINGKGTKV